MTIGRQKSEICQRHGVTGLYPLDTAVDLSVRDASLQILGEKGDRTPLGHEPADLQTPVGIEIIHHPIVALHRGQLVDDVGEMGSPIRTGTGLAQIPHEVACRHHEGGQ